MRTRLILVEGLPGSGKSTIAELISSELTELDVRHECHLESPDAGPVKFIWPKAPTFRDELIRHWTKFVEDSADREDLLVLDAAYWQWTTLFMVKVNFPHDDVVSTNTALHDLIAPLQPLLVYLAHADVEKRIRWTYDSRGREWSDFMIKRDLSFEYHQSRGHDSLDGIVECYEQIQLFYEELFDLTKFGKIKIQDPPPLMPALLTSRLM